VKDLLRKVKAKLPIWTEVHNCYKWSWYWWQCNGSGDSPVQRGSADHNEINAEAKRLTACTTCLRSSSSIWLHW